MAYALVTGAAKGIGRSIARELAARNYHLLLIDIAEAELERNAHQIRTQYGVAVHTLIVDLSLPGVVRTITAWQREKGPELEVVVNNAGFGLNGPFLEIPIQEQMDILNVNVKALVELSYVFVPVLARRPVGYLLNVCSTTAYQTVPYVTMYAASKAFVRSFTRGLRHELRHSNVRVTMLSPGSTDTDFVNRARMGDSIKRTAARVNMTAEEVAQTAVKSLFKGKAEVIPGFLNQFGAFLPRIIPMKWIEHVAGRIYEPRVSGQGPTAEKKALAST